MADAVAATPGRSAKIALLADLLARLAPTEVGPVGAMLTGVPRQGRIGVGWRTVNAVETPSAAAPSLSVAELDVALDHLAACAGSGSAAERRRLLERVLARATPAEQLFVRRLLTGELRQGALDGVMVEAVARASGLPVAAVRRAAMMSGNLATTAAAALAGGAAALAEVRLQVGRPVLPMLAATSVDVASALAEVGRASVEWKIDGARVQVHRDHERVWVFTRNGNDVTSRLPAIVAAVRAMPAHSLVLDGEAVGLDDDDRPEVFQRTMRSFGRHGGTSPGGTGAELAVRFFDILHRDGRDLLDHPLLDRLAALDAVAGLLAVPRLVTDDAAAAEGFARSALAAGHEGVMVKAVTSAYEAGRRGRAWRKVKPVHTLDLVVLAVEWGSGRRRGWLSNLHLGARHPATGALVMVGKTFKGLTDELLAWQTAQLLARRVAEHGHVVTVRPELVVEVALDGVQSSTRYPGGVALRFARVRRYRLDKDALGADTIDAVRSLGGLGPVET